MFSIVMHASIFLSVYHPKTIILFFAPLDNTPILYVIFRPEFRICSGFSLSTVFCLGGKQTRFCLSLLTERWFFGIFSSSVEYNFLKFCYDITINDTIPPYKFHSKLMCTSKDVNQKLTLPSIQSSCHL